MIIQTVLFYAVAFIFGLPFLSGTFISIIYLLPSMLFFACMGIFIGVIVKNQKQAGPISSIIITGSGLLGGIWLPVENMGKGVKTFCECLPFYNCVSLAKNAVSQVYNVFPQLLIILIYVLAIIGISVIIFNKKR